MRCPSCQSYIPSGLPEPIVCPQCGKVANTSEEKTPGHTPPSDFVEGRTGEIDLQPRAFAPYLTVVTRLTLGAAEDTVSPAGGSVSFGPEGFSVVLDSGRRLEKFYFRDLGRPSLLEDAVELESGGPRELLRLFQKRGSKADRGKAEAFVRLLEQLQDGLNEKETARFKARLEE